MRKWTYILAFMGCSALQAQDMPVEVGANQQLPVEDVRVSSAQSESNYLIDNSLPEDDNEAVYLGALNDSLHLPTLDMLGHRHYIGLYPLMGWGLWDWNLHEGLNVSLGTSVFSQFGRHAYHGVGFTQNVAAMYAVPLTSKLSLAVGGYYDHISWAHRGFHDAGINAVIGYMFDQHWEAYLYGQKSLTKSKMPLPIYHIGDMGDRIGAALKYNFNPSTSVELNVEYHNYPRDPFRPFSHYWP
ncbi:MAG: transporter [Bacteroidaceae bacterium]|nr:transporter [Bacteroidaceae bacterium]